MYILETEDKKTGLKDGSATAGRNFFVRGAMLKVVGDDESVGVTLTNASKAVTKLTDDLITINNPSSLTLLLPTDLEEGEYTLTEANPLMAVVIAKVRTRFDKLGKTLFPYRGIVLFLIREQRLPW